MNVAYPTPTFGLMASAAARRAQSALRAEKIRLLRDLQRVGPFEQPV
jgi:hypothetical protein